MEKNRMLKCLLAVFALCAVTAAGIFFYQDYYKLKEADLILFMGQSNMSGAGGNAEEPG